MNDPNKQPGYHFASLRVISAEVRATELPKPGVPGDIDIQYADRCEIHDKSMLVVQTVTVRVLDTVERDRLYLQASIELEGRFEGVGEVNIEPQRFAEDVAPSILFPFSREWIHRLTSATPPWPPVLLPPLNLASIRKAAAAKAAAEPKLRRRGARRAR